MKTFEEYVKEKKVIKKSKDPAEAISLFKQAEERLADLQNLPLTEKNAAFRFEDGYEVLREALQAFLAKEGYKPYSHEAVIAFAKENNFISEREAEVIDRYREIRNDINYRGKKVIKEEVEELLTFVKESISKLKKKFEEGE